MVFNASGGNIQQMATIMSVPELTRIVTDRFDQLFAVDSAAIFDLLTYRAPTGDTSIEWRDFRDTYLESGYGPLLSVESTDRPMLAKKGREFRIQPQGWQIYPFQENVRRGLQRFERNPDLFMAELADRTNAQARKLEELTHNLFGEYLVGGNSGYGGVTPFTREPLFSGTHTSIRKSGPISNIIQPTIGSWTEPTIADAYILMEAFLDKFMELDDHGQGNKFRSREQARNGMVIVTTSHAWDQAFEELRTESTLNPGGAAPATNDALKSNKWQNTFRSFFWDGEIGKAWENSVRAFHLGPDETYRPLRFEEDLGIEQYVRESPEPGNKVQIGWTMNFYLDAWSWFTGVLAEEA